jgi:hypothetical protein
MKQHHVFDINWGFLLLLSIQAVSLDQEFDALINPLVVSQCFPRSSLRSTTYSAHFKPIIITDLNLGGFPVIAPKVPPVELQRARLVDTLQSPTVLPSCQIQETRAEVILRSYNGHAC